ncbi:MAG: glycosyltransferase [Chloroflexi bacterium]|nr:glycosyltransferase [Chloroflexota bacterium]
MRVLFLAPQMPYPPHKGTSLRNFHLIRGAAAHHEVHLLTFAGSDLSSAGPLRDLCASIQTVPSPQRAFSRRLASFFLSSSPDLASRLSSAEFARKVGDILRSTMPEIVQVEGLELAPYFLGLPPSRHHPVVILDEHNAEYALQKRAFEVDRCTPRRWPAALYSLVQWQKLKRYEGMACRRANAVIAVSEEDKGALLRLDSGLDIAVVPNGVDCAYFQSQERRQSDATLVFTGTMDFRPNIDAVAWFAREVLPLVQKEAPEARFVIAGGGPTPTVRALAGASVEVTGFVPDVRPYLARAAVYVIPIRMGGGVRFKALEAMASGVPIVSTTVGVEGISVSGGQDLLLADDAPSFATAVLRLLSEHAPSENSGQALGRGMAERARRLVEQRYDWDRITPLLSDLYDRVSRAGMGRR